MTDTFERVAVRLLKIERELRRLDLWEQAQPSAQALASPLPFCHDALTLPQWLQFVFLVRMKDLIQHRAALPSECGIAPYADEYFKPIADETLRLRKLLAEVDEILTTAGD